MITWIQIYPLLAMPTLLISVIAWLPVIKFNGHVLSGMQFSEWLLDHLMIPILPNIWLDALLKWFAHAGNLEVWMLVTLVALNINALLLPLLYWMVKQLINTGNWFTNKSLELKTDSVRR